jgi:DNA-binding CsgD family transcriptional regulator
VLTQTLPAAPMETPVRCLEVLVESVVVRLALLHVAERAGWHTCRHSNDSHVVRVTDGALGENDREQVLVVRDTPADCQRALEAVVEGRTSAVVLWNDPETLDTVLGAVGSATVLVPHRVIDLATAAPGLTTRQRSTLHLLAMGRSNQAIAAAQMQSVSTTKRDIAELFVLFDVSTRTALTRAAARLGFI